MAFRARSAPVPELRRSEAVQARLPATRSHAAAFPLCCRTPQAQGRRQEPASDARNYCGNAQYSTPNAASSFQSCIRKGIDVTAANRCTARTDPMMFPLFRRNARQSTISTLYGTIVAQARLTCFYSEFSVPDTL